MAGGSVVESDMSVMGSRRLESGHGQLNAFVPASASRRNSVSAFAVESLAALQRRSTPLLSGSCAAARRRVFGNIEPLVRTRRIASPYKRRRASARCCAAEQLKHEPDQFMENADRVSTLREDMDARDSVGNFAIPYRTTPSTSSGAATTMESKVDLPQMPTGSPYEEHASRHLSRLSALDSFFEDELEQVAEKHRNDPPKRTDLFLELQDFFMQTDAMRMAEIAALLGSFALILSLCIQVSPPPVEPLVDLATPPTELSPLAQFTQFLESPRSVVSIALGLSAFAQSLTGFGFAIISVGILTQFPWISNSTLLQDVQPIAAICGLFVCLVNLIPSWRDVQWKEAAPVMVASVFATPFGAELLNYVDVSVALKSLGAVIFAFVIYLSSGLKAPRWFASKPGGIFWGSLAGLFGGAFDIQGPPLVFWTQGTDFRPDQLRATILAVCAVNSVAVIAHDLTHGRMDDFYVMEFVKVSLPVLCGGIVAGRWLNTRLDPANFRKVVLLSCFVMGVRLLSG